jgi:hypothetical protein
VKTHAHWHLTPVGEVRHGMCDLIMQAQGRWDEQLQYLRPISPSVALG